MISFKQFVKLQEDGMGAGAVVAGPTNVTAGVAGIGAPGPGNFAEPGVDKKKKHSPVMGGIAKRKPPKM
jgi:hypothetical protein